MRWLPLASALAALGLVACDATDDRPATLDYISPAILEPNCATAGCHSKLTLTKGIGLYNAEASYTYLVQSGLVVPYRPYSSKLMSLLRGDNVVRRMPPDQPLPDADIDLIERWILAGAPAP